MQAEPGRGNEGLKPDGRRGRRDNLALVYQGFLTGIVRLQAKRQQLGDPDAFRQRMQAALKDAEREASALGYDNGDIREAEFAIVAFLDEVILRSDDPGRQQWAKHTLGVHLFQEASAGDVFFEHLDAVEKRRNSSQLGDLLEVYLLCLLLGFEGRHALQKGEIHAHIDVLRRRLETIRQFEPRLTPEGAAPNPGQSSPGVRRTNPVNKNWQRVLLLSGAGAALLFAVLKLSLWSTASRVESMFRG